MPLWGWETLAVRFSWGPFPKGLSGRPTQVHWGSLDTAWSVLWVILFFRIYFFQSLYLEIQLISRHSTDFAKFSRKCLLWLWRGFVRFEEITLITSGVTSVWAWTLPEFVMQIKAWRYCEIKTSCLSCNCPKGQWIMQMGGLEKNKWKTFSSSLFASTVPGFCLCCGTVANNIITLPFVFVRQKLFLFK